MPNLWPDDIRDQEGLHVYRVLAAGSRKTTGILSPLRGLSTATGRTRKATAAGKREWIMKEVRLYVPQAKSFRIMLSGGL